VRLAPCGGQRAELTLVAKAESACGLRVLKIADLREVLPSADRGATTPASSTSRRRPSRAPRRPHRGRRDRHARELRRSRSQTSCRGRGPAIQPARRAIEAVGWVLMIKIPGSEMKVSSSTSRACQRFPSARLFQCLVPDRCPAGTWPPHRRYGRQPSGGTLARSSSRQDPGGHCGSLSHL